MQISEPESAQIEQSGLQLVPDAGDQEPRAFVDHLSEILIGDSEIGGDEIEDGVEFRSDI